MEIRQATGTDENIVQKIAFETHILEHAKRNLSPWPIAISNAHKLNECLLNDYLF